MEPLSTVKLTVAPLTNCPSLLLSVTVTVVVALWLAEISLAARFTSTVSIDVSETSINREVKESGVTDPDTQRKPQT